MCYYKCLFLMDERKYAEKWIKGMLIAFKIVLD
jgi:hypothetical protein